MDNLQRCTIENSVKLVSYSCDHPHTEHKKNYDLTWIQLCSLIPFLTDFPWTDPRSYPRYLWALDNLVQAQLLTNIYAVVVDPIMIDGGITKGLNTADCLFWRYTKMYLNKKCSRQILRPFCFDPVVRERINLDSEKFMIAQVTIHLHWCLVQNSQKDVSVSLGLTPKGLNKIVLGNGSKSNSAAFIFRSFLTNDTILTNSQLIYKIQVNWNCIHKFSPEFAKA